MKKTETCAWTKTNIANLYRHRNGRYYARIFVGGKEIWKSLKTKLKSVAIERLQEPITKAREQRGSAIRLATGVLTFGDAVELYRANFQRDPEIRDGTKNFREAGIKRVLRTWPELAEMNVRKITPSMVREWTLAMRSQAKPYVPTGARGPCRNSTGVSATTFNCALDALRQSLDLAVDAGYLFTNPAGDKIVRRATPRLKRLALPSREQFQAIVAAIEQARCGECRAAAEMVRFLAYTGARQKEANHVLWQDVDFARGRITLRITKNGDPRDVPMIPECRLLLEQMCRERPGEPPEAPLLRVRECRGFLEKACRQVGAPRVGHHGLRHLFATTAIEAGINVPTLSRIMGHRDGGALRDSIIYGDYYGVYESECYPVGADHRSLLSNYGLNTSSAFIGRNVARRFLCDPRLEIGGDYDIWLRCLSAEVPFHKVDLRIAKFHVGGLTTCLKFKMHNLMICYFLIVLNTKKAMKVGDAISLCLQAIRLQIEVSLRKLVGRRVIRSLKVVTKQLKALKSSIRPARSSPDLSTESSAELAKMPFISARLGDVFRVPQNSSPE